MAEKAKQSKKDNKNLIIGCCAAIAVVIAIIITVVLINNNSLNDNYFVSDNTKYVLTIETDESDNDEYAPLKTHLVYTYDGDKVTGMKTYYVYGNNDSAKKAFDALKEAINNEEEAKSMELNDKYIIITASEESYKDLTASDVKQQIEFMESLKNMDLDSNNNTSETVEETTTETTNTEEAAE